MMGGVLALLGAATLWGLIGTATRFAFREGVTTEDVAFYRALITGLGFLLVSWRGGGPDSTSVTLRSFPKRLWWHLLIFAIFGVLGLNYTNLKAVETGGVGFAAVFLYMAPLWVAIWGRLYFSEVMTRRKALSLFLAVSGVALVGFFGGGAVRFTPEAIVWGLISSFSYSLYYVFGRAYYRIYPPYLLNGLAFTIAMVFLGLLALGRNGEVSTAFTLTSWTSILFASVFSTLFAYALYSEGLKRVEATRASILCSTEPVIAMGSAYLVWSERMSVWGYAGAALVLTGVSLSVISASETPRSK